MGRMTVKRTKKAYGNNSVDMPRNRRSTTKNLMGYGCSQDHAPITWWWRTQQQGQWMNSRVYRPWKGLKVLERIVSNLGSGSLSPWSKAPSQLPSNATTNLYKNVIGLWPCHCLHNLHDLAPWEPPPSPPPSVASPFLLSSAPTPPPHHCSAIRYPD